jgi:hypothetical protein
MIKIGIIGYNNGNGHPYSYSSIVNGFNKSYLKKYCKYPIIKDYLLNKKSKQLVNFARVTHIWTGEKKISNQISKIANIPNICNHYKDFFNKVDGVILARDDLKLNYEIIKFFVKKKIPLFVDKQITTDFQKLLKIENMIKKNKTLFFAGSCIRFSKEIASFKKKIKKKNINFVVGNSRSYWIRYAHHILEPLIIVLGTSIKYIKCEENNQKQILKIKYKNGIICILIFDDNFFDIKLNFLLKNNNDQQIIFKDYYSSFSETLKKFILMVKNHKKMANFDDIFGIARIVLQGQKAINNPGKKIYL